MANSKSTTLVAYFHPSPWGHHFLRFTSLDQATQAVQAEERKQLKEDVKKKLISSIDKPVELLHMIDAIERLGVAYHFHQEIEDGLQQLYKTYPLHSLTDDLYHLSTRFRILRHYGFYVTSDVFKKFRNEKGEFGDEKIEGILSLYEASHVRTHGDDILDEAFEFTTTYLNSMASKLKSPLKEQIAHALHQPLHKGILRLESKHYISFYQQYASHDKTLLKFAKLDFNVLQYLHQKEFQQISRWWKELYAKVPFARDRLVEGYLWVLGTYYEPEYSAARKMFIKIFMIVQVFDDIFDAYGSYDILKLLVEAINRWDYSYVAKLPEYFNSCYKVLLETLDEIERELAIEGSSYGVQHVKDQMRRVCGPWLKEVKWCAQKYIPTYEEYMENAILSIAHIVGINASFLGMGSCATKKAYQWVCQDPMPTFVKASNLIFRLLNDLASTEIEQNSRNHVASSVQCYMKESGIEDKEQVYKVLKNQVEYAWKDMNQGLLRPYVIPRPLLDRVVHIIRGVEVFYKGNTDGYTVVNQIIKDKIISVLVDPVPL